MPITRFPHGISSFGVPLFGSFAALPQAGTRGQHRWVDTTNGINSNTGLGPEVPVATITQSLANADDGIPTIHHIFPGSYAESPQVTKRNQVLIGETDGHNGIVQIVGDASSARATLTILQGYLRGFGLFNIELDVTTITQPALHLETDSAEDATATAGSMRFRLHNVSIRSSQPNVGFLFEGATLGLITDCTIVGPSIGIALTSSAINIPNDLYFKNIDFADCVTADIATVNTAAAPTTITSQGIQNIWFERMKHWDRGGTPVTNYVNFPATGLTNVHFFDCYWARDVADDTLLVLPLNVVALGHSAAGVESIIGA